MQGPRAESIFPRLGIQSSVLASTEVWVLRRGSFRHLFQNQRGPLGSFEILEADASIRQKLEISGNLESQWWAFPLSREEHSTVIRGGRLACFQISAESLST